MHVDEFVLKKIQEGWPMAHLYFKHVLLPCRDVDHKIEIVLGQNHLLKFFIDSINCFLRNLKIK